MDWIITKVGEEYKDEFTEKRIGFGRMRGADGRRYASATAAAITLPYEWRTLDSDGYVAYEGRCSNPEEALDYLAFEPLDYSEADVGAVRMEYRLTNSNNEWRRL